MVFDLNYIHTLIFLRELKFLPNSNYEIQVIVSSMALYIPLIFANITYLIYVQQMKYLNGS